MESSGQKPINHNIKNYVLAHLTWLKLYIPIAMLALTPVLSKYLLNSYQLSIQEIWFPLVMNLTTAAILTAGFYRLWSKNRLAAYIGAILATAILTNGYDFRFLIIEPVLQAIIPLPKLTDQIYSLILIALILITSYWSGRGVAHFTTIKKWNPHNIITAISIAIGSTFVLQAIPAARNIATAWPQFFYQPPKITAAKPPSETPRPDIYYIVLDRYASPEVLSKQFNYNNADFLKFLSDKQFYIREDSHQNYPYTAQSVASTMNLDYNHDMIQKFGNSSLQTIIPYNQTIRNSALAKYLKSIGYKYTLIGNWYETSNLSPYADQTFLDQGQLTLLNKTFVIDNFGKNELLESPYWRLIQPGLTLSKYKLFGYNNAGGDQMTLNQIKALKTISKQPAGNKFVFAHMLIPHDPYFFNADGSLNPYRDGDNNGQPIKQKYINQVKFINEQIKDVINQINSNSRGQAVIILQADEGPYPIDLNRENFNQDLILGELANGSMLKWSDQDLQMKFGNLAAYYIPGASESDLQAGGTTVNAFRLVLNTLFNTKLPYLPDCYYAYPNGRAKPFLYKKINARIAGQDNPKCTDDGTGPK
jgi:hypothetical protein